MADQVSAVPTARASVTRPSTGWAGRIGWTVFIVGYLVFAVLTIVNLQSGLHGDPRLTNPHPGPAPSLRSNRCSIAWPPRATPSPPC